MRSGSPQRQPASLLSATVPVSGWDTSFLSVSSKNLVGPCRKRFQAVEQAIAGRRPCCCIHPFKCIIPPTTVTAGMMMMKGLLLQGLERGLGKGKLR